MAKAGKTKRPKTISAKAKKVSKAGSSGKKLPSSFSLTRQSFTIFLKYWRILGSIFLVYLASNLLLAGGLDNYSSTVADLNLSVSEESTGKIAGTFTSLGTLFGSPNLSGSPNNSLIQSVLIVLISLVVIWTLRRLVSGKKVGLKEAFYQSMYPLIPFLIVIFVILLQLLPISLGSAGLAVVLTSIFSNTAFVTTVFILLFVALTAWSLYMISSSIFALYIVTLPDVQPRQALRTAKSLVKGRRWSIMRRIIFLPFFIVTVMLALLLIGTLLSVPLAVIIFYLLSMSAILFAHTYLYSLYRSLL